MARSLSSGAGISGLGGRSGSKAAADSSRNANIAASVSSFDNAFTKLVAGLQSQQPNRQTNPLFGAYNPLASQQPNRGHPPGYPQPLTAGPPGQRQATVATTRTATNNLESLWNQSESSNSVYGGSAVQMQPLPMAADSPWQHGWQPQNIYTTGQSQLPAGIIAGAYPGPNRADPSAVKPMNDSLPPDAVAKYYPRGIPSDMTGHYRPLPEAKQKALDRVGHDAGRKIADSSRDFDDIFYSGQRRYATMKGEDFITELEDRQRANANPFGPIGPPKKIFPPGPALKKEITPEEMARMSIAEAAAPMIDAAFGSLLAYAEKGPESRKYLSGFVEAAPWQIDSTDKGNETMFGEDWGGRQPKRFGRDSRHQTRF
ncbi:hypothetical protein M7I_6649 [Glarea lozoyensis 74030]|uniref:Uncharacterized protein n=1 Tax=Glarea lozoyensis (strain ATCC 74030 / MF5533) TaxID=1104152 RepID=H0EV56_GLAL7|nr:hypothetical protein M7I_6649 [Glarea lozoyensis 74030]